MRIGHKQKQKRIRRRGSKHNNKKSIATTAASANDPNATFLTKQKRKRNRGKARKKFQRLSAKEQLSAQKILAQKLSNKQSESKDSGPSNSQIVSAMQESKNSILKLLGDKSVENELETTFEDDANFLQDLDLVILAASSEDYKRYCQLLRMEYEHMSDVDYKNMRLKVLQTLLSIPNIFSTTEFQTRYEATARANMKDEISTLKV